MASKPTLSFGFAKKAEPKRHVAALSTKKEEPAREQISAVEEGQLAVEIQKESAGLPIIKCKNPLDGNKVSKKPVPNGQKPKTLGTNLDDLPGGLVTKNMSKLSAEDAEAMRELLLDASREGDGSDAPAIAAAPILMKDASKKVRESGGAEATKEMFENVPVESFGEAMLRGMGYDPNLHNTKPVYRDKVRDGLLGLGAKALLPGEKAQIAGKKKGKTVATVPAATAPSGNTENVAATPDVVSMEDGTSDLADSEAPQKRRRTDAENAAATPGGQSSDVWVSRGLVVRIICKRADTKDFFGAEAVVLEVDEVARTCRVKARPIGGGKSQVLPKLEIGDLETRVSRDCEKVRVVRGSHKGTVAKLLKRDTTKGVAILRIDGDETEMTLDSVCQFMG